MTVASGSEYRDRAVLRFAALGALFLAVGPCLSLLLLTIKFALAAEGLTPTSFFMAAVPLSYGPLLLFCAAQFRKADRRGRMSLPLSTWSWISLASVCIEEISHFLRPFAFIPTVRGASAWTYSALRLVCELSAVVCLLMPVLLRPAPTSAEWWRRMLKLLTIVIFVVAAAGLGQLMIDRAPASVAIGGAPGRSTIERQVPVIDLWPLAMFVAGGALSTAMREIQRPLIRVGAMMATLCLLARAWPHISWWGHFDWLGVELILDLTVLPVTKLAAATVPFALAVWMSRREPPEANAAADLPIDHSAG